MGADDRARPAVARVHPACVRHSERSSLSFSGVIPAPSSGNPRSRSHREGVGDRLVEGPWPQPGRRRLLRVVRVEPREVRVPHREPCLVPIAEAEHPVLIGPDERRVGIARGTGRPEDVGHRRRLPGSDDTVGVRVGHLDPVQHERPEVPCVDPLDRRIGRAGGEHLAAGRRPPHPVREAIGRVVRSHDVARPDHEESPRECGRGLGLARHLQGPIGLVGHLLRVRIRGLVRGRVLVGTRREVVGMDGERGDQRVMTDAIADRFRDLTDVPRDEGAGVQDGVPRSPAEGPQTLLPVAVEVFDVGEIRRLRLPAVEHCDLVAAARRLLHERASEEPRAADRQDLHRADPIVREMGTRRCPAAMDPIPIPDTGPGRFRRPTLPSPATTRRPGPARSSAPDARGQPVPPRRWMRFRPTP